MIPQGYYRIRSDRPAIINADGSAAAPVPDGNPGWPVLLRIKAIPLSGGNIADPSFAEAGWYMYCGPVRADGAHAAIETLRPSAYSSGYFLAYERIHILPPMGGMPWPSKQGRCFGWQAEYGRPSPSKAVYQNFKLALYHDPNPHEKQGQIA